MTLRAKPSAPGMPLVPLTPLTDYFYIAGLDAGELLDSFIRLGEEYRATHKHGNKRASFVPSGGSGGGGSSTGITTQRSSIPAPLTDTIEEDRYAESENYANVSTPSSNASSSSSYTGSWINSNGTSRLTSPADGTRLSYRSCNSSEKDLHSNRSSMTIKEQSEPAVTSSVSHSSGRSANGLSASPAPSSLLDPNPSPSPSSAFMSDADFSNALMKFASERDNFLTDLALDSSSATQKASSAVAFPNAAPSPSAPNPLANLKQRPRLQQTSSKPPPEEPQSTIGSNYSFNTNTLRSGFGSVRRHMSFRDMNSSKRQPSLARHTSIRNSRRMSNYDSVVPIPQPLESSPEMHPLKRKLEPVLLDRFPPKSWPASQDNKTRHRFPDYVPMFAFPDDINIVSSDQRPRSTWHGFAMTSEDGTKTYSICVTVWIPLNHHASSELEKRCEEWRGENMTAEQRELAASLGERLAHERAQLSQLLSQLPSAPQGSIERIDLEDQISSVEETIAVMTDILRPVRHGAASKIEGLTDGDTGFWIPRAYGVLGRDPSMLSFWKEWLRAVTLPMMDDTVQRVPSFFNRIGRPLPLERYVINICLEATTPSSSLTQLEVSARDLKLYARKEANNELPGSRSTDLYPLFRALSISNIINLFEHLLAESHIILYSSHKSMLHLTSRALVDLMFPLQWTGLLIPVLPTRLLQFLEAPTPYIIGIERRHERPDLPLEDYVLVDLDHNTIETSYPAPPLPRHQRRKLQSLLYSAAPLHTKCKVPPGPPNYAKETFPFDIFSAENSSVFMPRAPPATLSKYVALNSNSFGNPHNHVEPPPIYNAFSNLRNDIAFPRSPVSNHAYSPSFSSRGYSNRPRTSSTSRGSNPSSPNSLTFFPQQQQQQPIAPLTPKSRNDSGFSMTSIREKRSFGHFDNSSKSNISHAQSWINGGNASSPGTGLPRRPSVPYLGHSSSLSVSSSINAATRSPSIYARSNYATSTVAPSTVIQSPSRMSISTSCSGYSNTIFVEAHCLRLRQHDPASLKEESLVCSICEERSTIDEPMYGCTGCYTCVHDRCAHEISIVCPAAFHADQIRAAFVRCFASLFYTYKKFMTSATSEDKRSGRQYAFQTDAFVKSLPSDHAQYMNFLKSTHAFTEFISERECASSQKDPRVVLFDEIILSKRNRGGRTALFGRRTTTSCLSDTAQHQWRTTTPSPLSTQSQADITAAMLSSMSVKGENSLRNAMSEGQNGSPPDIKKTLNRTPAKLDPTYMLPTTQSQESGLRLHTTISEDPGTVRC